MAMIFVMAFVAGLLAQVSGHGMMLWPLSRNAPKGINTLGGSMWFSQGCTIGCTSCNETGVPVPPGWPNKNMNMTKHSPNVGSYNGDLCAHDHSKMPGVKAATNNNPLHTTMNAQSGPGADTAFCLETAPDPSICGNWSAWNPWRAPGSTPGFDPCGIAGGAHTNMSMRAGGFGTETGYPQGFAGSKLPAIEKSERSVWKSGGVAEVSWASVANHAGGYMYSLCKSSPDLTEECFDANPLQFASENQKLRYMFLKNNGTLSPNHTEVTIPATRVTGAGVVYPPTSTWTKNPVPPGSWTKTGWQGNQHPPQFAPPPGCDEHCWGYQPCNEGFTHPSYEGWNKTKPKLPACANGKNGEGCCHTTAYIAVVDEVHVPNVPAGDYVVRWRWDAEQSPQIWSGCGDVTIV